jgi:Squalene-hopene cyclase C-terminal domain
MLEPLATLTVWLTILGPAGFSLGVQPASLPERVRTAVAKSLRLLEKSSTEYTVQRKCFSCHHQTLPVLALSTSKERGVPVSEDGLQKQIRFTAESLAKDEEKYRQGLGQGGQADTAGYALLALELGKWQADTTTSAVAEYLLLRDKDLDHWRVTSRRPPSEVSSFTTTYLAIRGLRAFASPGQQERARERIDQAQCWLMATPAKDTEDLVFRLGALKLADADDKVVQEAVHDLLVRQRKDGGWSQTRELESDAYATGSALVMLHQAGGLAVNDPVYQRGLGFLVASQQADGSWHVHSRSTPFQTYFESGFPYANDQFISIAASSWATTALALDCPVVPPDLKATSRTVP